MEPIERLNKVLERRILAEWKGEPLPDPLPMGEVLHLPDYDVEADVTERFAVALLAEMRKEADAEVQRILYGDPNVPRPVGIAWATLGIPRHHSLRRAARRAHSRKMKRR